MKVTHICTSLSGGAGICASRIISSTRELGIEARALVKSGKKDNYTEIVTYDYPWSSFNIIKNGQALLSLLGMWPKDIRECNRINKVINLEKEKCKNNPTFTSPITIFKHIADHPWVKDADLVHLHWIGTFVDYTTFFINIDKPIIWTLHDENPGLGGFHYSIWKENAPDSFKKLDNELMTIKERAYKKIGSSMTIVAISKMMEEYISNNKLLKTFPHVLIHNGVDMNAFNIILKSTAREALAIPKNNIVFLFSAYNIHEDRKGLKELITALSNAKIINTTLVCLGNYQERIKAPFEIRYEGFVSNAQLLSIYYSAADFFVMPSYQEAFAQTPLEALSCGTPVISFPCSGTQELINDKNGIICQDFTIDSLTKSILQVKDKEYDKNEIRQHVKSKFSYDIIAKQYFDLYHNILNNKL